MSPLPPTRERPINSEAGFGSSSAALEPQRRSRRWLRRIGVIILVVLAVLLGAVAAAVFYAKSEIDDLVTPRTAQMRQAQQQLKAPLPGQPANVLLLGSDHRKSVSADSDKRSDTLLLVRLDPKRKSISMISFPRDLYVNIPGHGESKINDAYSLGGPALSVKTIKEVTGLDVNFVMNVDFTGFRGVVDQLGGVWVDVDRRYFNDNTSGENFDTLDIKPGYQLLNGRDALDFARFRHDTRGDFNRIARQQQVLAGLKKQVGQSNLAKNVPGLFRVFKKNTEVVAGGGDSVNARVLYNYLRLALDLDGKDVYQVEYEGLTGESPAGASIVVYEQGKMDDAVAAFLAPSDKARETTADQLVGKRPVSAQAPDDEAAPATAKAPAAPDPATISVTVRNGSGETGVAGSMADQLAGVGYKVDPSQSNADNPNYASTKVLYATAADMPAAEALASRISGASTGAKDASNPFSTKLLVIVGDGGTKVEGAGEGAEPVGTEDGPDGGTEYSGNKVPEKGSAKVLTDPELARADFFETRSNRFPIMYPTVHEDSSTWDEVFGYQFARGTSNTVYDAYRAVAKTANGDYWGLQGTSWPNPPILEGPTREVVRGRRTYKLYFNGTKLHMIAWREGKGTYWVSNSVLNNLSNETMLAIADGVKPLR